MKTEILKKFEDIFGDCRGVTVYFAPGRVNLIGEHTDYNGGHVFPCALSIGTYAAVRKRNDRKLFFYSMNFEDNGVVESNLDDMIPSEAAGWTNYPKGVIWAFDKRGMKVDKGMDILIYGNIPNGSGLSSSASLEVLTGYALKNEFNFSVTNIEIALIGQYSENNFNGMNCGIMDQFASAMGKKDHAIFLNTADLSYEYAPIKLANAKIVVTNSNVKHSLVGSSYNDRRRECEEALQDLQKVVEIQSLGELNEEQFLKFSYAIKDKTLLKRAKHAVLENQRTIQSVDALKSNDLLTFGKLMNESHVSLRDDYEVSCDEIDILVDEAWKIDGVIGSRITGGGFGGCTVSIVKDDAIENFMEKVGKTYKNRTNKEASFYMVEIGDGPRII